MDLLTEIRFNSTNIYCLMLHGGQADARIYIGIYIVNTTVLITSAVAGSEGLMSILGWNVSREPLKYLPFMSQFVSLGVQVDLSLLSWRTSWLLTTNLAGSLLLLHLFVEL